MNMGSMCTMYIMSRGRVGNSHIGFSSELLVFVSEERKCESLIFFSESHFCSFLKSDVSKSLTVALLLCATYANCSFVKSDGSKSLK